MMEMKKRGRPKKSKEMKKTLLPTVRASGRDPGEMIGQSQTGTMIEKVNDLSFVPSISNSSIAPETIILPDFNGDSCEVSIENWIDRFEELAKLKNLTEDRMIIVLGNFLKQEALEWYMITTI